MTLKNIFTLKWTILFLILNIHLFGQKHNSEVHGLYLNTPQNPKDGSSSWGWEINKDSTFCYIYNMGNFTKSMGCGKWSLIDSVIRLRFEGIPKWGKHKTESYVDKQAQELEYEYDEYIIKNNFLYCIADNETCKTGLNSALFEKK